MLWMMRNSRELVENYLRKTMRRSILIFILLNNGLLVLLICRILVMMRSS